MITKDLFEDVERVQYVVKDGYKIPHSDFVRDDDYYEQRFGSSQSAAKIRRIARMKDITTSMYGRRWQSAKAVIDEIARFANIDPENSGLYLYALRADDSSAIVDALKHWSDRSGDKAQLKKRVAELEAQLFALQSAIRGGGL